MTVQLVSDQKIAETTSKGNQEKWQDGNIWYKLDQFGYEALAEVFTSQCWNTAIPKRIFPSPLYATVWSVFWFMAGSGQGAAVRIS